LKVKILSCMMIPYLRWLCLFIVTYFRLMYSNNSWSYRHLELAYVDAISIYFAVEVQRTYKLHVFQFISTLLNNVSLIKSFFFVLAWACKLYFLCIEFWLVSYIWISMQNFSSRACLPQGVIRGVIAKRSIYKMYMIYFCQKLLFASLLMNNSNLSPSPLLLSFRLFLLLC